MLQADSDFNSTIYRVIVLPIPKRMSEIECPPRFTAVAPPVWSRTLRTTGSQSSGVSVSGISGPALTLIRDNPRLARKLSVLKNTPSSLNGRQSQKMRYASLKKIGESACRNNNMSEAIVQQSWGAAGVPAGQGTRATSFPWAGVYSRIPSSQATANSLGWISL